VNIIGIQVQTLGFEQRNVALKLQMDVSWTTALEIVRRQSATASRHTL
jgi:hypothetical protein